MYSNKTTHEDYADFALAVRLKRLGFNWEVLHFYCLNVLKKPKLCCGLPEEGGLNNHNKEGGHWSAPSLSQVQKWLFEKYGLWVEQSLVPELDLTPHKFVWQITHKQTGHVMHGDGGLDTGINKAIELIKEGKFQKL